MSRKPAACWPKPTACIHLAWESAAPLALGRRRTVRWVAVSGHGAEGEARIGDGRERYLYPLRRLYEDRGKDFAAALDAIGAAVDLGAFRDILDVANRHAPMLSGLG